jgi:hypothetical protein
MKLPRDLGGGELIKLPGKPHGCRHINQEGSQVILETDSPRHHRLAVPDHNPLRVGTLDAILRAVAEVKAVEKDDLLNLRQPLVAPVREQRTFCD